MPALHPYTFAFFLPAINPVCCTALLPRPALVYDACYITSSPLCLITAHTHTPHFPLPSILPYISFFHSGRAPWFILTALPDNAAPFHAAAYAAPLRCRITTPPHLLHTPPNRPLHRFWFAPLPSIKPLIPRPPLRIHTTPNPSSVVGSITVFCILVWWGIRFSTDNARHERSLPL